jgi:hypothetical protein
LRSGLGRPCQIRFMALHFKGWFQGRSSGHLTGWLHGRSSRYLKGLFHGRSSWYALCVLLMELSSDSHLVGLSLAAMFIIIVFLILNLLTRTALRPYCFLYRLFAVLEGRLSADPTLPRLLSDRTPQRHEILNYCAIFTACFQYL